MYNCQCCDMAKRMQKATGGDFQNPRLKDRFLGSSLLGYSYNFKGRWLDCIATTAGCCDLKDFSSASPSNGHVLHLAQMCSKTCWNDEQLMCSCSSIRDYKLKSGGDRLNLLQHTGKKS